jgi:hypothetical protein
MNKKRSLKPIRVNITAFFSLLLRNKEKKISRGGGGCLLLRLPLVYANVAVGMSGCGSIKVILDPAPTLLGLKGLRGVTQQVKN